MSSSSERIDSAVSLGANSPAGVMTADYSRQRREQLHVAFRLQSRALTAIEAFREFAPDTERTQGVNVLDLGAAEGATLNVVHAALGAKNSIGIEYSAELIAQAPTLHEGIELVQGDVTEPSPKVEPGSRDLVLALAVLEHLEDPLQLFVQAYRALKPGGLIVATCPSGLWDEISGLFQMHPEEHHEQAFKRRTFEGFAESAGLESVTYRRFMNAPMAFLPYLRIPISPGWSGRVDSWLRALRVFELLFVNQLFVARKPIS